MTFTESDFKALSQQSAAALQPQSSPSFPLNSRVLFAVGAGFVGVMVLGAIAGVMQRPTQPQAVAPSPTPVAVASPSPDPKPSPVQVMPRQELSIPRNTYMVVGEPDQCLNLRDQQTRTPIDCIPSGQIVEVQAYMSGAPSGWVIVHWQGLSGVANLKFLSPVGQGNSRP